MFSLGSASAELSLIHLIYNNNELQMEITKSMSRVPLPEGSDFFFLLFPPQGKRWLLTVGERGPISCCLEGLSIEPFEGCFLRPDPSPLEQGSWFLDQFSLRQTMVWELGFLWVLTVALAALWEVMGRGQTNSASSQLHLHEFMSRNKIPQSYGQGRALRILGGPGSWPSAASLL